MQNETERPERVTIIKERSSGGTILVALMIVIALVAVGYMLLSDRNAVDPADASIAAAADKVGTAAQQVGDAAQDAAQSIQ